MAQPEPETFPIYHLGGLSRVKEQNFLTVSKQTGPGDNDFEDWDIPLKWCDLHYLAATSLDAMHEAHCPHPEDLVGQKPRETCDSQEQP